MKKMDGYFTVEAALVMPLVFAVIVFVIYFWFFQYDRCLFEQDTGMVLVRASAMKKSDAQKCVLAIEEDMEGIYEEKYIAWERGTCNLRIGQGEVTIEREAALRFPFGGWYFGDGRKGWAMKAVYKCEVIAPESILRKYRWMKEKQ